MNSEVSRAYDKLAKNYVPSTTPYWQELFNFKTGLVRRFSNNARVIELGCGTGEIASQVADFAAKVVGIDFSRKMLEEARKRHKKSNLVFRYADITKTGLPSEYYDVAFSFSTMYNIKNVNSALREINRILKIRGIFVLDLGNSNSLVNWLPFSSATGRQHDYYYSAGEMNKLIKDAGFEIMEHHCLQILPMYSHVPFPQRFWQRVFAFKVKGKMLDEIISSAPLLRNFAFRHLFVCRKV